MKALMLLLALSACADTPQTNYLAPVLPLPARPALPILSSVELQCLAGHAYDTIIARDRARRAYEEQLEAVICATHTERPCP